MDGLSIDETWDYTKMSLCESGREVRGITTQGRKIGDAWWNDETKALILEGKKACLIAIGIAFMK